MAQQRYHLNAKVLTAFFLAAMPFVAFGSFIVVNQARNLLRESAGSSLEQRAVQTKLALEQYVADHMKQYQKQMTQARQVVMQQQARELSTELEVP